MLFIGFPLSKLLFKYRRIIVIYLLVSISWSYCAAIADSIEYIQAPPHDFLFSSSITTGISMLTPSAVFHTLIAESQIVD